MKVLTIQLTGEIDVDVVTHESSVVITTLLQLLKLNLHFHLSDASVKFCAAATQSWRENLSTDRHLNTCQITVCLQDHIYHDDTHTQYEANHLYFFCQHLTGNFLVINLQ